MCLLNSCLLHLQLFRDHLKQQVPHLGLVLQVDHKLLSGTVNELGFLRDALRRCSVQRIGEPDVIFAQEVALAGDGECMLLNLLPFSLGIELIALRATAALTLGFVLLLPFGYVLLNLGDVLCLVIGAKYFLGDNELSLHDNVDVVSIFSLLEKHTIFCARFVLKLRR